MIKAKVQYVNCSQPEQATFQKFESTILDALVRVFSVSSGAYWEPHEESIGLNRGDKYFRLIEHTSDKFEFLTIGFKRLSKMSTDELHHQLASRLPDYNLFKKRAKEAAEFQNEVLNQIALLQLNNRAPRRLILGKRNYETFQRIKQKYPNYPDVLSINGREQRWGMQIEQDAAEDRLEVLP